MNGEIIKKLRIERGMTMEELAEKLNISKATVHKYEKGIIKNIPLDKLEAMSKIFSVPASYLTGWEDEDDYLGEKAENEKYLRSIGREDLIEVYNDILKNDNLVLLFDKAKNLSPKDLEQVLKIIDTFRKETDNGL